VADAAARSGLPLREAEGALQALAAEYTGHLAATSKGELVYSFPQGLVKPPETRLIPRVGRAIAKFTMGAIRLVVRAWVSVVLVGYALVFLAILLALTLRGGDDRDNGVGDGISTILRVIAEALFWTFHPFSPVYISTEPRWMHAQARRHRLPFYERVNRFVFGPTKIPVDPREQERNILAEIRRQKGRIAPADVVRVTGLSREDAEHLLLRLVVDYDGEITVSDSGAIMYSFVGLRTTTTERGGRESVPAPVWSRRIELPPLTGNSAGSNVLFALINGFNLIASGVVLANGLTLERLTALFVRLATRDPELAMTPLPAADGIPLVLGAIPFAFSVALFALPLLRLLRRRREMNRVERENGWRGVLREVLASEPAMRRVEYTPAELSKAWAAAAGRVPGDDELQAAAQKLGGEVDLRADGTLIYKFDMMAREVEALLAARAGATDEEASAGRVIFSSADEGAGLREDDDQRRPPVSSRSVADRPSQSQRQDQQADGREAPANSPGESSAPNVKLLEEERKPLDFIEQLLTEASSSRRRK
ncbi:MAG: hypothetical protein ABI560_14190, partial [Myxococcales bacterium]